MKKVSLLSLAFLSAITMFSQQRTSSVTTTPVQFGIKAGVNIANIKDDLAPNNTNSRTGYHFGALAHIHVAPNFAIQPEVVFSSEGADYTLPNYTGKDEISYINIPVLAQYMFSNGLRLQTGPQLGIKASSKFERTDGTEIELPAEVNDLNFSWSFGAGFLSTSGLGIDARYNLGISNMYETGAPDAKGRVWQLGVFYQFNRR